jgi:hypothetical protein
MLCRLLRGFPTPLLSGAYFSIGHPADSITTRADFREYFLGFSEGRGADKSDALDFE